MNENTLMKYPSKKALRYYIRTVRNAIGSGLAARKAAACVSKILAHPLYQQANIILAYCAHGGEIDVSGLCESAVAQGKTIALPVCDGRGGMVAAVPILQTHMYEQENETDRYGITQPKLSTSMIVSPSEIDLVIVPGVAFGSLGQRVGWGAGYYDKFLPGCKQAYRMGAAFEEQILQDIESDSWDVFMDAVVTDKNIYEIKKQ